MELEPRIVGVVFIIALLLGAGLFFLGGFKLPGTMFSAAQIQSISMTTLNGKDAVLISLQPQGGADVLTATLSKTTDSRWTGQAIEFVTGKAYDRYIYTLTDRTGSASRIPVLALIDSYDGGPGGDFSGFKSRCLGKSASAMAFNTGDIFNSRFRCYDAQSKWIVSDFDRASAIADPGVFVQVNNDGNNLPASQWSEVVLTRANPKQTLVTDSGEVYGEASMGSLSLQFVQPPPSSGIKAIRNAAQFGPGFDYYLVDASIDSEMQNAASSLGTCLGQAQKDTTQQSQLVIANMVLPLGGSYEGSQLAACFDRYNSKISSLQSLAPTGDFRGADTSKLTSARTVTVVNSFTIPNVLITLYASKVGIKRASAVPQSVSCDNKDMAGGVIDRISAHVTNGPDAGTIYWTASCSGTTTVRTSSGSVQAEAYQTVDFGIDVSSGSAASTSSCAVTAKSTDLTVQKTGTCGLTTKSVCQNSPRPGFYIDENCNEYCPLKASQCAKNQVYNSNTCTCDSNPNSLASGASGASSSDASSSDSAAAAACLPLIQSISTKSEGGINVFGFNLFGTNVSTCSWDPIGIGALLLVLGLVLAYLFKEQDEPMIFIGPAILGIGLLMIVLGFLLGSAASALIVAISLALIVGAALIVKYVII